MTMDAQSEPSQSLVSIPKKRSQADKIGRIKYQLELLHQILDELKVIRITQRHIITGLELAELMHFDQPYIEKVCSRDDVDKAILRALYEAGHRGILPKDLLQKMNHPGLRDRWQILHRIKHMNRRLNAEIGQQAVEKHGHEWALTEFAYQAFKLTKEELDSEPDQREQPEKEES